MLQTRTKENPYYYIGKNPTVDFIALKEECGELKILLVKREREPDMGKWALPGGFQDTSAKPGGEWYETEETSLDAVIRELSEETGLEVKHLVEQGVIDLEYIGEYEGSGRDPRDNKTSWSCSRVFMANLTNVKEIDTDNLNPIDKQEVKVVKWANVENLENMQLAFDHRRLIQDGLKKFFGKGKELKNA